MASHDDEISPRAWLTHQEQEAERSKEHEHTAAQGGRQGFNYQSLDVEAKGKSIKDKRAKLCWRGGKKNFVCVVVIALFCLFIYLAIQYGPAIVAALIQNADDQQPITTRPNQPFTEYDKVEPYGLTESWVKPNNLAGKLQRPIPTHAFWLNFILDKGHKTVAMLPYSVSVFPWGVQMSYADKYRTTTRKASVQEFFPDLTMSADEGYRTHYVESYSPFSATLAYELESGGSYRLLAAKGSPYVTFEFAGGATPILHAAAPYDVESEWEGHTFASVNGLGAAEHAYAFPQEAVAEGTVFDLRLSNGDVWLLWTSSPARLALSPRALAWDRPFTGAARLCRVLSPEDRAPLLAHAPRWPVAGGPVGLAVDRRAAGGQKEGRYAYEWETRGEGPLLMFALPHHVPLLERAAADADAAGVAGGTAPEGGGGSRRLGRGDSAATAAALQAKEAAQTAVALEGSYFCMKGPLVAWASLQPRWELRDASLPNITWFAPRTINDEEKSDLLINQLRQDMPFEANFSSFWSDVYNFGKQITRIARLTLMAEEYGQEDLVHQGVSILEHNLTPWLLGKNDDSFQYETQWGGLVTTYGEDGEYLDYGNAYYNDHHFHYGYFLYSFAVLIKYKPSFYDQHEKQINLIKNDIVNQNSSSQLFPLSRHKDFFDFHSWASGLHNSWDGKNQESISEAVNAYYGVYLFGLATGDQKVADWGQILLSMELSAGKLYWHMTDASDIYGEPFSSNKMVGQVAENSARYRTWFGIDPQYIHCVNMLPFTPITELLMTKSFVTEEYPVLASQLSNFTDGGRHPEKLGPWMSFVYMDLAVTDPVLAYNIIANHTSVEFDVGNSLSNTYYWIFTRP